MLARRREEQVFEEQNQACLDASSRVQEYLEEIKDLRTCRQVKTRAVALRESLERLKEIAMKFEVIGDRRLVRIALDEDKQVILGSSGEKLRLGFEAGPTMIKPNQDEIEALSGAAATAQGDVAQHRRVRSGGPRRDPRPRRGPRRCLRTQACQPEVRL